MSHLLAFAGVCLWTLSIAVVVQRQRVLHRRLTRIERVAWGPGRLGPAESRPPRGQRLTAVRLPASRPSYVVGGHVRPIPLVSPNPKEKHT